MKKTVTFAPTENGLIRKTTALQFRNKNITVSSYRPKTPELVADVEATTGKKLTKKRKRKGGRR